MFETKTRSKRILIIGSFFPQYHSDKETNNVVYLKPPSDIYEKMKYGSIKDIGKAVRYVEEHMLPDEDWILVDRDFAESAFVEWCSSQNYKVFILTFHGKDVN